MVVVYLVNNHPTKAEVVPNGTSVTGANIVGIADSVIPNDFFMNYNTYLYSNGSLVRDPNITINNNVVVSPTFVHSPALIVADATPHN